MGRSRRRLDGLDCGVEACSVQVLFLQFECALIEGPCNQEPGPGESAPGHDGVDHERCSVAGGLWSVITRVRF